MKNIIIFLSLLAAMYFSSFAIGADVISPMQESTLWQPVFFTQGDDPVIWFQQKNKLPATPFTPPACQESDSLYQCFLSSRQIKHYPLDTSIKILAVGRTPSSWAWVDKLRSIHWFMNETQKRTIALGKQVFPLQPYLSPRADRLSFITISPSATHSHSLQVYQIDHQNQITLNFSERANLFIPYWFDENTLVGWTNHSVFFLEINPDFSKIKKRVLWKTKSANILAVICLEDRMVVTLEDADEVRTVVVLTPDGRILKEFPNMGYFDDGLSLTRYCCCYQPNTGLVVLDTQTLSTQLYIPEKDFQKGEFNVLGYDSTKDVVYISINNPNPAILAFSPDGKEKVILRSSPEKPYFTERP